MRKTVRKLFWAWEFEKEEKWLNEMAAKGLALVAVGFCRYEFEQTKPGAYRICMQLLPNAPRQPESEQYMQFLEELGAEHVGTFSRWVYLRRPAEQGEFALVSDIPSRVKQLTMIFWPLNCLNIVDFCCVIANIVCFATGRYPMNLIVALLNLCLFVLISLGLIRLSKKRAKLKKQQRIFE